MGLLSTNGQMKVVNCTIEPKEWGKWLAWAKYSYNTSWHSTISNMLFAAIYRQDPPMLLTYLLGTARVEIK